MLVIIPCGGKKLGRPAPAVELYVGPYFKACLRYAQSLVGDYEIRILSAKYGLLLLRKVIAPYDLRMGQHGCATVAQVRRRAEEQGLLAEGTVVALGGKQYVSVVRSVWPSCLTPLEGVGGIGKQLRWLKENSCSA